MNTQVKEIIAKIKSEYADVVTILLFGSATTNEWTSASDIDIFLIDPSFYDSREDIVIDGVNVEIQKDNFKNITKDIENERGKLLNRNVATMINESIAITTKSDLELQNLKTLAKDVLASKFNYVDEDIKMWQYSIDDYLAKATKDLARQDLVAFYLDTHYVLQNALEMSLATHGAFLPQPKKLAAVLQSIDPTFYQIFLDFVSTPNPQHKLTVLTQLKSV